MQNDLWIILFKLLMFKEVQIFAKKINKTKLLYGKVKYLDMFFLHDIVYEF